MPLEIIRNDITKVYVDAIVNVLVGSRKSTFSGIYFPQKQEREFHTFGMGNSTLALSLYFVQ